MRMGRWAALAAIAVTGTTFQACGGRIRDAAVSGARNYLLTDFLTALTCDVVGETLPECQSLNPPS